MPQSQSGTPSRRLDQVPCDSDCLADHHLSGFDNRLRDVRLTLGSVNRLAGRFAEICSAFKSDSAQRNYTPVAFVPKLNPFYCALPYNELTADSKLKPEASEVIPWFKQAYSGAGQSVCRHRWVAIHKGDRICYAEWEDRGPFLADHFQYVFGNECPKPNTDHGAGLSVSPAVRDYLGLAPTDVTDWQFVEVRDVPPGPWRSYGENNHFVIARRETELRAREQTGSDERGKGEQPQPQPTATLTPSPSPSLSPDTDAAAPRESVAFSFTVPNLSLKSFALAFSVF